MQGATFQPEDTELAKNFTVQDYREALKNEYRNKIADLIRLRFRERYLVPISGDKKHGFAMMAVSCLMIETLESFYQGWETTDRKSEAAFIKFFSHAEPFNAFKVKARDFYKHIRCGILHQAETTGGWRIRRDSSPLVDNEKLTINANRFVEGLWDYLESFCDKLKTLTWDDPLWKNVRKKLDAIVNHCLK